MKPFNLQEALAGKPVVTRDGKPVKQIAFFPDAKPYSIMAYSSGDEVETYTEEGKYFTSRSGNDLFMASTKVTKWVNLYRNEFLTTRNSDNISVGVSTFDSEADAQHAAGNAGYVGRVQVEWEE